MQWNVKFSINVRWVMFLNPILIPGLQSPQFFFQLFFSLLLSCVSLISTVSSPWGFKQPRHLFIKKYFGFHNWLTLKFLQLPERPGGWWEEPWTLVLIWFVEILEKPPNLSETQSPTIYKMEIMTISDSGYFIKLF